MSSLDPIGLSVLAAGVGVWAIFKSYSEYRDRKKAVIRRKRRRESPQLPSPRSSSPTPTLTTFVDDYVRDRFGRTTWQIFRYLLIMRILNFKLLRDIEVIANESQSTKAEVLRFKRSQMTILASNATAGSVYSAVAVSALRLDSLQKTHWTAIACFFGSLGAGTLSVWVACNVQRTLGLLNKPEEIQYWLITSTMPRYFDPRPVYSSSIWTAIILSAPAVLIGFSNAFALIGICLYLVFYWINEPNTGLGTDDNQNILISFLAITGFSLIMAGVVRQLKRFEYDAIGKQNDVKMNLEGPDLEMRANAPPESSRRYNAEDSSSSRSQDSLIEIWQDAARAIDRNTTRQEELLKVLQDAFDDPRRLGIRRVSRRRTRSRPRSQRPSRSPNRTSSHRRPPREAGLSGDVFRRYSSTDDRRYSRH